MNHTTPMILSAAFLASLGTLSTSADETILAEITSCSGVGTVEVTADTRWKVVTDTDTDTVASIDELPLSLSAGASHASAAIQADMSLNVDVRSANAFALNIGRDAACGVLCGGCSVYGNGEMVLAMHLEVHRPTTLRITRYSFWDYDVFPTITLQSEDGDLRTLYGPQTGGIMDGGEFEEFELRPGSHQLVERLRFVGCGPYMGDSQHVGGYIHLDFEFTEATRPADVNGDGTVDGEDLSIILGNWGGGQVNADVNGDGRVDGGDLAMVLGDWS